MNVMRHPHIIMSRFTQRAWILASILVLSLIAINGLSSFLILVDINPLGKTTTSVKREKQQSLHHRQQPEQHETDTAAQSTISTSSSDGFDRRHPVCRSILTKASTGSSGVSPLLTADSIWAKYLSEIESVSQSFVRDKGYEIGDFTSQLLDLISPRLYLSAQAMPRDWSIVERIMNIVAARLEYIQHKSENKGGDGNEESKVKPPPPLRVVVFGGSITKGTNCQTDLVYLHNQLADSNTTIDLEYCRLKGKAKSTTNIIDLDNQQIEIDLDKCPFLMMKKECAWPNQLQTFLDRLAGGERIIEVTNLAIGSSRTRDTTETFFKYGLIPAEVGGYPDVVINAHSSNDVHYVNQTMVTDMMQEFVRAVWKHKGRKSCNQNTDELQYPPTPMILHLYEFLGAASWTSIMLVLKGAQMFQTLANYYGYGMVSYTNMVQDLVYGDTTEQWLSAPQWADDYSGKWRLQRHLSYPAHLAIAWSFMYYFISISLEFCSLEEYPAVRHYGRSFLRAPKEPPSVLHPPFEQGLQLGNISVKWQGANDCNASAYSVGSNQARGHKEQLKDRCILSWLAGVTIQLDQIEFAESYFQPFVQEMVGWEFKKDHDKLGLVVSNPNEIAASGERINKLKMRFESLAQPISEVVVFYMKSYGPDWEESEILIRAKHIDSGTGVEEEIVSYSLYGNHTAKISVSKKQSISFPYPVPRGDTLTIEMTLVKGQKCKIRGLALCSF